LSSKPAITDKPAYAPADVAAIENELPTYRAISPLAVGSLVAALIGLLCYTNSWFLISSGVAIVLGAMAIRKIKRQPDVFTGTRLAQAGVVVALVSSLSSVTMSTVQSMLVTQSAERFIKNELLTVLEARDLDSALWWKTAPEGRVGLDPSQVRKRFEQPSERNATMFEMMAGPVARLVRELKLSPGARLEFRRVEQTGTDGLTPYAFATIRIAWPPEKGDEANDHKHDPNEHGELLAVLLKSKREGRRELWWVEDYYYPYTDGSYQPKVKPVDDGHGHGH
jgi:hypothetical protein